MDRLDGILKDLRDAAAGTDPSPQAADARSRPRPQPARSKDPTKQAPSRSRAGAIALPAGRKRLLIIMAAVLVALLGLSAISGLVAGATRPPAKRASQPVITPSAAPTVDMHKNPGPLQWKPVIEQLDLRRGRMFMDQGNLDVLTVDALSSPAFNTDDMLLKRLQRAQAHLRSYPMRVISVTEQYSTVGEHEARALVTVVDELGAYDIVDAQGRLLRSVPARGRATWNVELRNTTWGWVYVSSVRAATK